MDLSGFAWLIPMAPLAGFIINGLFGKYFPETVTGIIGSAAVIISFILSVMVFLPFTGTAPHPTFEIEIFTWFTAGKINVPAAYLFDSLSIVMILVVTGVGSLIHIYSIGYMKGDRGIARYFAYLNLFIFFMLNLVLGSNLVVMFLGWEGVGLCSYLLIGYYYETDYAPAAGLKAFIVNRIGDMGFLIGIFIVIAAFGTVRFGELARIASSGGVSTAVITAATLMFFIGATGKSAQIPLYVWLPDAMAGPTPVSALIHAATMVTAGVYMVVRLNFLYILAPASMATVAVVGGATALFAATIGIMQMDIKKVLAYSTISQLGYMFMAAGIGAFSAGIFHLVTHAFFKALLFLGSGSVIMALHHEQDLRNMGGLRRKLPVTFYTFLAGTLAIAGTPLFSGFFSKDEILWRAYNYNFYLWCAGILAAAITSYYMFRLVYLAFSGEKRFHEHGAFAVHESPKNMTIPLVILALFSVAAGLLGIPHLLDLFHTGNYMEGFLSMTVKDTAVTVYGKRAEWMMMGVSVSAALAGFLAATAVYWKNKYVPGVDTTITGIKKIVFNKYYIDELYRNTVVSGTIALAKNIYSYFDLFVIDGIVNGTGRLILRAGQRLRSVQTGVVHDYMFSMIIGVTLLLIYILAYRFFG